MWRWIVVAIIGSVICTVGDHLHATHGVLGYTHVFAWNQAWWVPLLFFGATLGSIGGAHVVRRLFKAPPLAPNSLKLIIGDGIAFAAACALTSFTHTAPNETMLLLAAFWLARVLITPTPPWLIALSFTSAIMGPLVEATVSGFGLFAYTHPDFVGVSRWLPGIYLYTAPISARLEALLVAPAALEAERT
ncbi:MAG: hypothetical protein ABI461_24220 [Polyangiaceae bacterium]